MTIVQYYLYITKIVSTIIIIICKQWQPFINNNKKVSNQPRIFRSQYYSIVKIQISENPFLLAISHLDHDNDNDRRTTISNFKLVRFVVF